MSMVSGPRGFFTMHDNTRNARPRIDVFSPNSTAPGWAPINALCELAARVFDGSHHTLAGVSRGRLDRIWHARRRGQPNGQDVLLAILYRPSDIIRLRRSPEFRDRRHGTCIGWIIDSFNIEDYTVASEFRDIDLLCITRADEIDHYRRLGRDRVLALNWGADVAGRTFNRGERPVDLQRVGRQPDAWDDDQTVKRDAAALGLRFNGRPPLIEDPIQNQQAVIAAYDNAKFALAHSNLVSEEAYTHRGKEYVTGRWTDALASGCSVAGVPPKNDQTYRDLFWPGATLEFDRIDLRHNLDAVRAAVDAWTPQQAAHNHMMALQRLDWRHSLKKIADRVGITAPLLDAELQDIARRAEAMKA